MPAFRAIVVAHTHWDREWYATFEQFRIRLVRLIESTLDLLEQNDRFRFYTLDGQTVVLEDYLDVRPDAAARLTNLVREQRLHIGPWYVLPDEFLVSGEALVRNLMLGREVAARFGGAMNVGYVPDSFGHVSQLPQILAGFGIDSFVFSRGLGDEGETVGSEFLWMAPDGTALLAIHQIGWDDRQTGYLNAASLGYASPWVSREGGPDPDLAVQQLRDLSFVLSRYSRAGYVLINNGGDHLPPQAELPDILDGANARISDVTFEQGTFAGYVDKVRAASRELSTHTGELRGSRYSPLLAGVLSARLYLKQENASTQSLLEHWAESWSLIASLLGRDYPDAFLRKAWRYLLQNHPHDSICGCSIDAVHDEMMGRFAKAQQIGNQLTDEALEQIGAEVDISGMPSDAVPIAVFNALPWARSGYVTAALNLPASLENARAFQMAGPDGTRQPCQVLDRRFYLPLQSTPAREVERILVAFVAPDVPAFGYAMFGLAAAQEAKFAIIGTSDRLPASGVDENGLGQRLDFGLRRSDRTEEAGGVFKGIGIENEFYELTPNEDGTVDIVHRLNGVELRGALLVVDEADGGDEYTFAPTPSPVVRTGNGTKVTSRVLRCGPAVSTLALDYELDVPTALGNDRQTRAQTTVACAVHLEIDLYAGIDRVRVHGTFDNKAADHRLRLLMPTDVVTDEVRAGGHFGVIRRRPAVTHVGTWAEEPSSTGHCDGFVDVSDGTNGVTVITPGLPEYELLLFGKDGPVTLALTLLRCVGWLSRDDIASRPGHAGPGVPTPGAQCPGPRSFELGIYLHRGNWLEAGTHRQALENNVPLRAKVLATPTKSSRHLLPTRLSFMSLEGEGLVLSALKRAESDERIVVRVYNAGAEPVAGRLSLYRPIAQAELLRLDEQVIGPLTVGEDGTLSFEAGGNKILTFGLWLA